MDGPPSAPSTKSLYIILDIFVAIITRNMASRSMITLDGRHSSKTMAGTPLVFGTKMWLTRHLIEGLDEAMLCENS